MNQKKIRIYAISITTLLAAFFHIISNFNHEKENIRKKLSIISGIFWALSGLVVLLFVNFDKNKINMQ